MPLNFLRCTIQAFDCTAAVRTLATDKGQEAFCRSVLSDNGEVEPEGSDPAAANVMRTVRCWRLASHLLLDYSL